MIVKQSELIKGYNIANHWSNDIMTLLIAEPTTTEGEQGTKTEDWTAPGYVVIETQCREQLNWGYSLLT